ncbi:hypothetical protein BJX99DRAFT_226998 [Aspergillus californicus]
MLAPKILVPSQLLRLCCLAKLAAQGSESFVLLWDDLRSGNDVLCAKIGYEARNRWNPPVGCYREAFRRQDPRLQNLRFTTLIAWQGDLKRATFICGSSPVSP